MEGRKGRRGKGERQEEQDQPVTATEALTNTGPGEQAEAEPGQIRTM